MRRLLVALCALLLVFTACGGDKKEAQLTTDATGTPSAEETTKPGETAKTNDGATGSGGQTDGGGSGTQTTTTAKPASEGGVNRPKEGEYIYDLDGKATDPLNPAGGQQSYPSDAEVYVDVSYSGAVTSQERTSSEQSGAFTTRSKMESDKILFLSFKTETQIGTFSCTFDPPLLIAHIPLRAETIPKQQFKGSGNACDGNVTIQYVKQQNVADGKGKSWSTWQVKVHTEANSDQFSQKSDDVRYLSPDLGIEIKSDGTSSGTFKTQAGTNQNFNAETHTLLKKYP